MITRLGGWSDLLLHLHVSRRAVQTIAADAASVTITPDQQLLLRALTSRGGQPWVSLAMVVAPLKRLHLRGALVANSALPIGGLAAWNDQAVLRQTLPLRGLAVSVFEDTASRIAALTEGLRNRSAIPYVIRAPEGM